MIYFLFSLYKIQSIAKKVLEIHAIPLLVIDKLITMISNNSRCRIDGNTFQLEFLFCTNYKV
ncbi:9309_t:CDS:2 [Dentiscutata heterogama]|uniref:9309_t:CDS:1 n=1 Tax=Dentiscutata heterogama TaxID=1316150 RepID=A0ACA9KA91_9GLOM|nr:9309_t:CDS:2 [Dentiscutata heterogama]